MKKRILPLLVISLFNFGCFETPTQNTSTPSPANSSSPSPSSSTAPTVSPTTTPTVNPTPVASASASTSTNTSTKVTCTNEEPVVGNTYQDIGKFVCATDARLNSKWTYSTTTMGITSDISVQVVEVNGDKYTVESEVTVNGQKQVDRTTTSSPSGYTQNNASQTQYKYVGTESVSVGAGTFNAYKFTGSESKNGVNIVYNAYIARNRGLVKMLVNTEAPIIGTVTTEVTLKGFQP